MADELKKGNNGALSALKVFQPECIKHLRIKTGGQCDPDTAYDLFIDAVLDFRKNVIRNRFEYGSVKAYLKQVCWYKWMELVRYREKVQSKTEDVRQHMYDDDGALDPLPDQPADDTSEKLERLKKALARLSEKCRTILLMAIRDEYSMAEIAESTGLANANTAKVTKSRCYKQLMQLIEENEGQ